MNTIADVSPIVEAYIYLAGGLSIVFVVIIFCSFIVGGRYDEHCEGLRKEVEDKLRDEADKNR